MNRSAEQAVRHEVYWATHHLAGHYRILRVRMLGSATDSDDVVAAELLEELARKKAVQPGTNLRLVYELPPNRTKRANQGSNTLNRCPNVCI